MFDIGWTELLLIGVVALIVVGPKDLPRMFAALGRFTAKARAMGREFQRAMDDAARESGVREASADIKAMISKKGLGIDKLETAARKFESWDPMKPDRKPAAPAAGSETAKLAEKRAADAEARLAAAATQREAADPPAGAKGAAKAGTPKAGTPKAGTPKASGRKAGQAKADRPPPAAATRPARSPAPSADAKPARPPRKGRSKAGES